MIPDGLNEIVEDHLPLSTRFGLQMGPDREDESYGSESEYAKLDLASCTWDFEGIFQNSIFSY